MEELLVIEICAGSARLTKTCRKLGLRGIAVDKHTERSCGIDVMVLDLSVDSGHHQSRARPHPNGVCCTTMQHCKQGQKQTYQKLTAERTQATRSSAKR